VQRRVLMWQRVMQVMPLARKARLTLGRRANPALY
jgi:hypothetical protein